MTDWVLHKVSSESVIAEPMCSERSNVHTDFELIAECSGCMAQKARAS